MTTEMFQFTRIVLTTFLKILLKRYILKQRVIARYCFQTNEIVAMPCGIYAIGPCERVKMKMQDMDIFDWICD